MDTTSSVLSRDLQILAENLDIQEKLRQELLNARAADGLTHDELNRLQLLDSVCRETLRVYAMSLPPDAWRRADQHQLSSSYKLVSEVSDLKLSFMVYNLTPALWLGQRYERHCPSSDRAYLYHRRLADGQHPRPRWHPIAYRLPWV